jgi:hypothetical protein
MLKQAFDFPFPEGESVWEAAWAPYDQPTYQAVLACLRPEDVVLEIGAGDLRLARQMAKITQKVVAIEIQPALIHQARQALTEPLPSNVEPITGDARTLPFPAGITIAVLLMRHCNHFQLYADKLKAVGCQNLITNARWHVGVEIISLQEPRIPYHKVGIGWYACWCGNTGFVPGQADQITPEVESILHEVVQCPKCTTNRKSRVLGYV